MSKRRSPIWEMSRDDLQSLISNSQSYKEVLSCFGLQAKGNNINTLKKRINEDMIDDSNIRNMPRTFMANSISRTPKEKIFIRDSLVSRIVAKRRIISDNIIDSSVCAECKMGKEWNGKPLVLILDHINGISNDHRIENLRFLCPNCNSQTATFAGRQLKKTHLCKTCGLQKKTKYSDMCSICSKKLTRKVDRPSKEELLEILKEESYVAVGKKYGVSDNAVRKWLK